MVAGELAAALGGRRAGANWMARCPAHADRTPSLSIREGDHGIVLIHCHAGCDQADVIAALQRKGLWGPNAPRFLRAASRRDTIGCRSTASHSAAALAIWDRATAAAGTLVELYLPARGLVLSPPDSLRFHNGLKHPSGGMWPCMVALVTRGADERPLAIHRTFLARGGIGKAPVEPSRMMLGPCRGGAVRLGDPNDVLMVGEGIETCLAATQATGHPAWAALSASGLRTLELPEGIRELIVLADGDDPGEAAARESAIRWKRQGRRVRIARPPRGMDFNDLLLSRMPLVEQGVQ